MFCNDLAPLVFTHIFQGYLTETGGIVWSTQYDCPSASEVTLKNIGECILGV